MGKCIAVVLDILGALFILMRILLALAFVGVMGIIALAAVVLCVGAMLHPVFLICVAVTGISKSIKARN